MPPTILQITLKVSPANRSRAAAVYAAYRQRFLTEARGARSKELLLREQDVQVLHGFDSTINAESYLQSRLFQEDVCRELGPLLEAEPEIRIYERA